MNCALLKEAVMDFIVDNKEEARCTRRYVYRSFGCDDEAL